MAFCAAGSRVRLVPAVCAGVALLASFAVVSGAAAGGPAVGATYVALGDSYAAGEGLGDFETNPVNTDDPPTLNKKGENTNPQKNMCHRSLHNAYGSVAPSDRIVLPNLPDSERANWACSGALSTDMLVPQGDTTRYPISNGYFQYRQPAQTDTVSDATKWISISAGGNDLEFSKIGLACGVAVIDRVAVQGGDSCGQQLATEEQQLQPVLIGDIANPSILANHLQRLYETLLTHASHAVLGVVGYPRIFPTDYSGAFTPVRSATPICVTNNLVWPLPLTSIKIGFRVTDAKEIDTKILQGLNNTAKQVVEMLAAKPEYRGRIVFADSYNRSDVVPQNCTGENPKDLSVNGIVLSPGFNGLKGKPGWSKLKAFVSSATFHPTVDGQKVLGRAVQAAFAPFILRYAGNGINITGTVGTAVSATTTVTAGLAPLSANVSLDGLPPAWVQLGLADHTIEISGKPTEAGTFSFNVIVSDARGDQATIPVTLSITDSATERRITSIAAGGYDACATFSDGSAKCWGDGSFGALGNGDQSSHTTPVTVLGSGFSGLAAAYQHVCGLSNSGLACWGNNFGGELGDGTDVSSSTPVSVSGLASGVSSVAAGDFFTCASLASGGAKCWGEDDFGQLGDGIDVGDGNTSITSLLPVAVTGLAASVTSISAGDTHTCAVEVGGVAQCWGDGRQGELGTGIDTLSSKPLTVLGLGGPVASISAGFQYTCAVLVSGAAKCWGDNHFGQLGDGSTTSSTSPVQVAGLESGVASIAAGETHTCALLDTGGVKCWGGNGIYGELGNGSFANSPTPVQVAGLESGIIAIDAGWDFTCALLSDDTVECWGSNTSGQLGYGGENGQAGSSAIPVQVTGL